MGQREYVLKKYVHLDLFMKRKKQKASISQLSKRYIIMSTIMLYFHNASKPKKKSLIIFFLVLQATLPWVSSLFSFTSHTYQFMH
jgi:hypothetical protein